MKNMKSMKFYLEPPRKGYLTLFISDASTADEYDIVGYSHDLSVEMLLSAYSNGIFPWPFDDKVIPWSAPKKRGILEFDKMHISNDCLDILRKAILNLRLIIILRKLFIIVLVLCEIIKKELGLQVK